MQEYWYHVQGEPFVQDILLEEPAKTIPLVWHTDAVKIFRNQKAWIYSYSSMTKKKHSSIANKMIFLVVRDSCVVKHKTHDRIGEAVAYATKVLQTGRYPTLDVNGQQFQQGSREALQAGQWFTDEGWRSCFAGFKSDLEARALVHKLTRNYMSNYICEHCPAGKFLSFRDFTDQAAWQDIRFSHEEFVGLNPVNRQSTWLGVPGWRKERNLEDLLHTLHQGVACCFIPAVIIDHWLCKVPGLTLDQLEAKLVETFLHYRKWCKANKLSATNVCFNRKRFGKEKWGAWPELSSHYKASCVKYMIYWVHAFLESEGGQFAGHQDRIDLTYSMAKFQWLLDVNGPWLQRRTAVTASRMGISFLRFYQELALLCFEDPAGNNYKITPKFHYFYHLCEYIHRTQRNPRREHQHLRAKGFYCFGRLLFLVIKCSWNPDRYEHCYSDESLMGEIGQIASRTHANTLEVTTLNRYRALLDFFLGPDMVLDGQG